MHLYRVGFDEALIFVHKNLGHGCLTVTVRDDYTPRYEMAVYSILGLKISFTVNFQFISGEISAEKNFFRNILLHQKIRLWISRGLWSYFWAHFRRYQHFRRVWQSSASSYRDGGQTHAIKIFFLSIWTRAIVEFIYALTCMFKLNSAYVCIMIHNLWSLPMSYRTVQYYGFRFTFHVTNKIKFFNWISPTKLFRIIYS